MSSFISHIYCPDTITFKEKGFLVGWNLENFRCCIGFVVTELSSVNAKDEDALDDLKKLLTNICLCDELKLISESCSRSNLPPTVLGQWLPTPVKVTQSHSSIQTPDQPCPLHHRANIFLVRSTNSSQFG